MKICNLCHAENEDDASFCSECGCGFEKDETPEPHFTTEENKINNKYDFAPTEDRNNRNQTGKIISLSVACIVLLFVIFNVLVCTDIINGKKTSGIEKYQSLVMSVINKSKDKNTDNTMEASVVFEKTTDKDRTLEVEKTTSSNKGLVSIKNSQIKESIINKIKEETSTTKEESPAAVKIIKDTKSTSKPGTTETKTTKITKTTTKENIPKTTTAKFQYDDYDTFDYIVSGLYQDYNIVNIFGYDVVLGGTTAADVVSCGLVYDFDENEPVYDDISGYSLYIYQNGKDLYLDFYLDEYATTYGDGVLYGILSEDNVKVCAANTDIYLAKTTLRDLMNKGWRINSCMEDYTSVSKGGENFILITQSTGYEPSYDNIVVYGIY